MKDFDRVGVPGISDFEHRQGAGCRPFASVFSTPEHNPKPRTLRGKNRRRVCNGDKAK